MTALKARGYRFDGVDDAVYLGPAPAVDAPYTVEFAALVESMLPGNPTFVTTRPNNNAGGGDSAGMDIQMTPTGGLHADIGNGVGYLTTVADAPGAGLSSGRWAQVAYVVTASSWTAYVDGVVSATGAVAAGAKFGGNGGHLFIGGLLVQGPVRGCMRDVRLWSRALAPAELAPFRPTLRGDEAGLVGWWLLEGDMLDRTVRPSVGPHVAVTGSWLTLPDRPLPTGDRSVEMRAWFAGGPVSVNQRNSGGSGGAFQLSASQTQISLNWWYSNAGIAGFGPVSVALPTAQWVWVRWVQLGDTTRLDYSLDERRSWITTGTQTVVGQGAMADSADLIALGGNPGGGTFTGAISRAVITNLTTGLRSLDWDAGPNVDAVSGATPGQVGNGILRKLDGDFGLHGVPRNGARPAIVRAVA